MIYGESHQNNILRLLTVISRLAVSPAPGGGSQRVQPIYVDDVVATLHAAVNRIWCGPNVIPLAGPPLSWREMVNNFAPPQLAYTSLLSVYLPHR